MPGLLWLIVVVVLIFWLFGQAVSIGGDLIHLLLVVILGLIIWNLFTGRKRV